MKILEKSTFFEKAKIEMSEEEYKAYMLGSYFGKVEGFAIGIITTSIIAIIIAALI